MIDISRLLAKDDNESNSIRYAKACENSKHGVRKDMGPVVAWNITQRCNFKCKHCYSSATAGVKQHEMKYEDICRIIDNMKRIKVPVILLSGGEPLMHERIFDVIQYIRDAGMRVSLSTNGSLITENVAQKLKALGVSYVGISLDGKKALNDEFRGVDGAFEMTMKGIENCRKVGQKVGLRMTIHKQNIHEVPDILHLMESNDIHRICFYHLVPSGRGSDIENLMLSSGQARQFIDDLSDYVKAQQSDSEVSKEILTVTNHTDGPYLYIREKEQDPELAKSIFNKLSRNRGNRSGIAIMNMDWHGNVYPDQFSRFMPLGNALETSLEEIWISGLPELEKLRNKEAYLPKRCKDCSWLQICGGNLRARAYAVTGDLWADDPGCYLEDEEL